MELKVGDTVEVIEITDSRYPSLYENGAWGVRLGEYLSGDCSAIIGNAIDTKSMWYVYKGTYRSVGKLTVKALKHG